MAQRFANLASTTLAAPLASGGTLATLASTAQWPTLSAGDILPVLLVDAATQTVFEIAYATARTGAVLTLARAQEGTTALTWAAGDYVYQTVTAAQFASFAPGNGSGATAIDTSATSQTKNGALTLTGGFTAGALNVGSSGANIGGPMSITGTLSASGAASVGSLSTPGSIVTSGDVNCADVNTNNANATNVNGANGGFSNNLTTVAFTNTGVTILQGTQISGGGTSPTAINSGANYVAIQGNNATTGCDISNANTGAGSIARFVSGSTAEANVDSGGAFHTTSDARLKSEVETIENGLDLVMALRPVRYTFDPTGQKRQGFIAQEVQEVSPLSVGTMDRNAEIGGEPDEYLTLTETSFIPLLVGALKSQQAQISELKALIATLQRG